MTSERFQSLSLFASIYGIGPNTARRLYSLGLRSLEDLEVYYGAERASQKSGTEQGGGEVIEVEMRNTPRWHRQRQGEGNRGRLGAWGGEKGEGDEGLGESWVRIALELREDLAVKCVILLYRSAGGRYKLTSFNQSHSLSVRIPREEVEEMGRVVMTELDELEPGCVSTIVGGYRRGKAESNDVDIVLTHPDGERVKGLCKRFVRRLHERGKILPG